MSQYILEKCRNDTFVIDGDDCIKKALCFLLKFKGEERRVENEIVEYNLQLHAPNGSGFDTSIILNNLPCVHIVDNIKSGKGTLFMRVFNGYIQNKKKQNPEHLIFRCGMTHLIYSLKK